jgi:uncharacterized protein YaaR (DUF327 family)
MAEFSFPETSFLNPAFFTSLKAGSKKAGGKEKTGAAGRARFSRLLEKAGVEGGEFSSAVMSAPVSEETVTRLLDEVHSAGDDLKKRPFPEEIKKYKQSVRMFMQYVVENGFTVEKKEGIPNYLKPHFKRSGDPTERQKCNAFARLHVIDEKLERLAADIMAAQGVQLGILARIDEISGLLVDLIR